MKNPSFLTEELWFPKIDSETDDLVAIGGDLSVNRLLLAYRSGIFPWFNPESDFLWWSPQERCIFYPQELKVSKSMRPYLNGKYRVTFNQKFEDIVKACSEVERPNQDGTWITEEIIEAYCRLHGEGYAHSVEVWEGDALVGGLYGVCIGKVFFGESMFSKKKNASKTGLIALSKRIVELGVELIDCQMVTEHLISLGAVAIERKQFLELIDAYIKEPITLLKLND